MNPSESEYPTTALTRYLNAHPLLVRWAYLMALALCVSYSVLHVVRFASITTDENVYVTDKGGVRIVSVVPGGVSDKAGLRVGDVIVEVNGKPVRTAEEAMVFIVSGEEGKRLYYTIDRSGERSIKIVVLADFGLALFVLAFVLTGAAFMFASAFVILRRPHLPGARLFGWSLLAAGMMQPLIFEYNYQYFPDYITFLRVPFLFLADWITISGMYHLFLHFPVRRFLTPYPRWLIGLDYALPIVMGAGVLLLAAVLNVGLTIFAVFLGCIAVMEFLVQRRFRAVRNPAFREKGRLSLIALALVVVVNTSLIFTRGMTSWQALFFIALLIPGLIFYTVIRYRIFDLYIVVRKSALYTSLNIARDVACLALFLLMIDRLAGMAFDFPVLRLSGTSLDVVRLSSFTPEQRVVIEKGLFIVLGSIGTGLLWQARKRVKHALDNRFFRGSYDYRRALQAFSHLTTQFLAPGELAVKVVDDLTSIIHLKGAAFAGRAGAGFEILAEKEMPLSEGFVSHLTDAPAWLGALAEKKSTQAVDNLGADGVFDGTGIEFITPIVLDGRMEAMIFLGEKRSETNFAREDVELLNNLSINVADALMMMRFYEDAKERERMRRELEIARKIQLSSLPADIPSFPGIDIAAVSVPAFEVGGDFYDFLTRSDSITCVVGDVSGKGTSSALYLSRIQGIIRAIDSYQPTLWELFTRLNTQAFDLNERHVFLTVSALRINLMSHQSVFLRAGHLPLLHYRLQSDSVVMHQPRGIGIGLDNNLFGELLEEIPVQPDDGDVCVMVSDGVSEAFDANNSEFGMDRISQIVRACAAGNARSIQEALLAELHEFAGAAAQHDDMTILVVKFG